MNTKRLCATTAAALALIVTAGQAALAENSWTSSLCGILQGHSSHTWADHNRDATATRVQFSRCTIAAGPTLKNVTLQLTYANP